MEHNVHVPMNLPMPGTWKTLGKYSLDRQMRED